MNSTRSTLLSIFLWCTSITHVFAMDCIDLCVLLHKQPQPIKDIETGIPENLTKTCWQLLCGSDSTTPEPLPKNAVPLDSISYCPLTLQKENRDAR